ncbi:hypothetical protein ACFLW0_04315 [Chloroflexota bacterium]
MDKRYKDKTALVTYISIGWGMAMFIITFILEGWNMDNIEKVISHPVGILAILLIIACIGLFIWNLRRKELSPDDLVKKRDSRLSDLLLLKNNIDEYIKVTYAISKSDSLYSLNDASFTTLLMLLNGNNEYQKLKIDKVGSLIDSINVISIRLQNSKIEKLINQTYKDEHKARSQQISIRLLRNNYPHRKRNESKLLEVEAQQRKANNTRKFAKTLKKLYGYIELMERGGDLWSVNIANQKTS